MAAKKPINEEVTEEELPPSPMEPDFEVPEESEEPAPTEVEMPAKAKYYQDLFRGGK